MSEVTIEQFDLIDTPVDINKPNNGLLPANRAFLKAAAGIYMLGFVGNLYVNGRNAINVIQNTPGNFLQLYTPLSQAQLQQLIDNQFGD